MASPVKRDGKNSAATLGSGLINVTIEQISSIRGTQSEGQEIASIARGYWFIMAGCLSDP
jgi:hypothetical protein